MKVAMLTTWDERCGIAAYAQQLVNAIHQAGYNENTGRLVDFWVLNRDAWPSFPFSLDLSQYEILHLNYEPGLFNWLPPATIQGLRAKGMKTILTLHTTQEGDNRHWPMTQVFDRVIVHEKTTEGFTHIPMGIPVLEDASKPSYDSTWPVRVGTVGFPFPWKGFDLVAEATKLLGIECLIIIPESHHWNAELVKQHILSINPDADIRTQWMTTRQVQRALAQCTVTAFLYDGGNYGISGAVRLGLGSGRPVVCTRNRQFRDLYDYEDEVWFCPERTLDSVVQTFQQAIAQPEKKPCFLLRDMNWNKVAQMYMDVYHEMLGIARR